MTIHRAPAALASAILLGMMLSCSEDRPGVGSRSAGDTVTLVGTLTVGAVAAGPDSILGIVGAMEARPDGGLFVADNLLRLIREYDAQGRFVREIARHGLGPGEIQEVRSLGVDRNANILAAYDPTLKRVSYYDLNDGSQRGGFTLDPGLVRSARFFNGTPVVFDTDTTLALGVFRRIFPNDSDPEGIVLEGLERYVVSGARISVRFMPDVGPARREYKLNDGRSRTHAIPFGPRVVWALSPKGGFLAALSNDTVVDVFDRAGQKVDSLILSGMHAPDAEEIARAREWANGGLRFNAAPAAAFDYELPTDQTALSGISIDETGTGVWIRRDGFGVHPLFDVFQSGRYRCTVRLQMEEGLAAEYLHAPTLVRYGRVYQVARTGEDVRLILVYEAPGC